MTVLSQLAVWGQTGAGKGGGRMTPEELLEALNQRRARKGLPPLTMEEARENERRAVAEARAGRNGR